MHSLRAFSSEVLALLVGVLLFVTIYWQLFDLQWIVFLAGVLFSSITATAHQAVRLQWLVARRTRQLQRTKEKLSAEIALRERSVVAQKVAETRFQVISDALPVMMLFASREERCLYHNRAFAHWCRKDAEQINGHLLREILGYEIYRDIESHCAGAQLGHERQCKVDWPDVRGTRQWYRISLLPHTPGTGFPNGFCILIEGIEDGQAPVATARQSADSPGDTITGAHEIGGKAYLYSLTEQLISGNDPHSQLVRALKEDHFLLYAQKILPLAPDVPHPACLEVLLRLQEEEQSMAPPGGFFPVAEHCNLMGEIDRWVVRKLFKWCAENLLSHPGWHMPLYCVNLSSTSLRDPEFARYVRSEMELYKFPASNLCLELAQLDVIDHHLEAQALMSVMRPHGCHFSLDAFGSAKVSFAILKGLTFDFIKIDGVIIQNILKDRADLATTRAITIASHKIGIRIIAEFVENDDIRSKLSEIGVDYVQGFGIGKPVPLAQLLNS